MPDELAFFRPGLRFVCVTAAPRLAARRLRFWALDLAGVAKAASFSSRERLTRALTWLMKGPMFSPKTLLGRLAITWSIASTTHGFAAMAKRLPP